MTHSIKIIIKSIIIANFFFGFEYNVKAQQTVQVHVSEIDGFDSNFGNVKEDIFGNKYIDVTDLGFAHFNSDSVYISGYSICKTDPEGNLIWNTPGFNGEVSSLRSFWADSLIYVIGSFRDTLIWDGYTLIENHSNDPNYYFGFVGQFNLSGELVSLNQFSLSGNSSFGIEIADNGFYVLDRIDSVLFFGNDTLYENLISYTQNLTDVYIGFINYQGQPLWALNIGGPSWENVVDLKYDEFNNSLILYGYFDERPDILPSFLDSRLILIEVNGSGQLNNARYMEVDPLNFAYEFDINSEGEYVTKEYNDSSENRFPATAVYSGDEKLGYYKYNFGAFSNSNQIEGTVYGSDSSFNTNTLFNEFILEDKIVADFIGHIGGLNIENGNVLNSSYSITGFNIDSLKFDWVVATNTALRLQSFNHGSQLLTRKNYFGLDTIIELDSNLYSVDDPNPELIMVNIVNCHLFEANGILSSQFDSLYLTPSPLNIQWYRNNQLIPGANSNKIKLIGSGNYHAELSNYYGCVDYSDTISVVSGINEEEYNSLKVYPNPGRDQINFEFTERVEGVFKVYDIRGVLIDSFEIDSNSKVLDVASWNEGVYIYRIENERGEMIGKIIVNRK